MMQDRHLTAKFKFSVRRLRRSLFRRAAVGSRWTALAAYLTLSLGISIPLPTAKKSGQPYPCMNHPCGCASAEQCWRHCCCTTLEQRLAWARENHVMPPDYALAEARAHGIDWESYCRAGADHDGRLCRDGEEVSPSCCSHTHATHSCCQTKHETPEQSNSRRAAPPQGVVWLEALACSGCDLNWLGVSVSLLPPVAINLSAPAELVARIFPTPQQFSSIAFSPPTPPPRAVTA